MTTTESEFTGQLAAGYSVRPAQSRDLADVVRLVNACEIEDYGEPVETETTTADYWRPMQLEQDSLLVFGPSGELVGYADQTKRNPVRLPGYACVHPAHRGEGLGSGLTQWVESRAATRIADAPGGARVHLQFGLSSQNTGAIDLLEERGYIFERGFQRMVIELDSPPPAAEWPQGVTVRSYVKGPDDEPTWLAVEEAFDDHWGNVRTSFEDWSKIYERDSFDASLWFLALAGDEIAGASLCSTRESMGWVGSLSVRRPWRRQGLAVALLRHSFAEFFQRGQRTVGLSVDSTSLTGATRVYERAGMRANLHTSVYSKMLRDGVEISTEGLD